MNYWIDTDAGVDDALALLWALQQNLNIKGISTVSGNLPVHATINNVQALLEHCNVTIPVYRGASFSFLGKSINSSHVHGIHLGPFVLEKTYSDQGHFIEGLLNYFKTTTEDITIVTLGPLTNIATFLIHFPEYKTRIARLLIMGGGTCGNIAPYGEFNIYADPEAAQVVFSSQLPIVLSDIDITDNYAYITPEEIEQFNKTQELEEWSLALLRFRVSKSHNPPAARIYDVLPFMYILHPELFTVDLVPVEVQLEGKMRGYTAYDYINNREQNFLFPEESVPRIERLRTIDHQKYTNLFLSNLIKK